MRGEMYPAQVHNEHSTETELNNSLYNRLLKRLRNTGDFRSTDITYIFN